jgi:hypothetical protein
VYPNKAQWKVIWIVTAVVCIGLMAGYEGIGFVLSVVIIGGLLFWKFSRNSN